MRLEDERSFSAQSPVGRYWLLNSVGFRVEGMLGRGIVEEVGLGVDGVDVLAVRRWGVLGRRLVLVPVQSVESIHPWDDTIVVSSRGQHARARRAAQAASRAAPPRRRREGERGRRRSVAARFRDRAARRNDRRRASARSGGRAARTSYSTPRSARAAHACERGRDDVAHRPRVRNGAAARATRAAERGRGMAGGKAQPRGGAGRRRPADAGGRRRRRRPPPRTRAPLDRATSRNQTDDQHDQGDDQQQPQKVRDKGAAADCEENQQHDHDQ